MFRSSGHANAPNNTYVQPLCQSSSLAPLAGHSWDSLTKLWDCSPRRPHTAGQSGTPPRRSRFWSVLVTPTSHQTGTQEQGPSRADASSQNHCPKESPLAQHSAHAGGLARLHGPPCYWYSRASHSAYAVARRQQQHGRPRARACHPRDLCWPGQAGAGACDGGRGRGSVGCGGSACCLCGTEGGSLC